MRRRFAAVLRRMREAWKRETCSVSVFFVRVGSQISPRRGEQYQSNAVSQGKQRQSNPYPMPCLIGALHCCFFF